MSVFLVLFVGTELYLLPKHRAAVRIFLMGLLALSTALHAIEQFRTKKPRGK